MMTSVEIDRLANALNALRPDWGTRSLRTWISTNLATYSWQDASTVAVNAACDPLTSTPARILERGSWWQAIRPANTSSEIPSPYHRRLEPDPDELTRAEYAAIGRRGASAAREALKNGGRL